ncbi:MAG TPA: hypothetical protein GX405_19865 [Rhizobiales bacterium]|nr:hypothetical protein [Hyphomicrobiales bacterium]
MEKADFIRAAVAEINRLTTAALAPGQTVHLFDMPKRFAATLEPEG